MDFQQSVQSYMQQVQEERRTEGDTHPDLQVLRAYHGNTLSPGEADRIQEHLAACSDCVQLFLGLVSFLEWDLDPHRLSVDDLARSWGSFLEEKRREQEKVAEELCPIVPG